MWNWPEAEYNQTGALAVSLPGFGGRLLIKPHLYTLKTCLTEHLSLGLQQTNKKDPWNTGKTTSICQWNLTRMYTTNTLLLSLSSTMHAVYHQTANRLYLEKRQKQNLLMFRIHSILRSICLVAEVNFHKAFHSSKEVLWVKRKEKKTASTFNCSCSGE